MQYSIGEFSKIAQVTLKALRHYHEKELLKPDFIDPESGYRYYSDSQIYEVRVIQQLKDLGFSLNEIKAILEEMDDDSELIDFLITKKMEIEKKVRSFNKSIKQIELILQMEKNAMKSENQLDRIEEKTIPEMILAGYRMQGQYHEMGKGFGLIAKCAGRYITSKPMCLFYDGEYKEHDADFEPCFELKKEIENADINCRTVPGGQALTIIHKGPYDQLGDSYKILFDFINEKELRVKKESREVYLKGPGMILRGNPEKYLTEIQLFIDQ